MSRDYPVGTKVAHKTAFKNGQPVYGNVIKAGTAWIVVAWEDGAQASYQFDGAVHGLTNDFNVWVRPLSALERLAEVA